MRKGASSYSGTVQLPDYTLVNLGVNYERDNWGFALTANNVTDEDYFRANFPTSSVTRSSCRTAAQLQRAYHVQLLIVVLGALRARPFYPAPGPRGLGRRHSAREKSLPTRQVSRWFLALLVLLSAAPGGAAAERAEIRAVVVTMFEHGDVRGDRPGELQAWVERWPGMREVDFPAGEHPLFLGDGDVLVVCTGGGIANATASILALGLDPRFDLSHAYWIVAGIMRRSGGHLARIGRLGARCRRDLLRDRRTRDTEGLVDGVDTPERRHPSRNGASFSGWTVDTIHLNWIPSSSIGRSISSGRTA